MTDNFEYFRPVDVSELMGWSLKTLANYRCEGVGPPYIKVGRKCLYPKVEFYRWLKTKHREQKAERDASRSAA